MADLLGFSDDGEAIHTAWFLVARDGENMPTNADVFTADLTPEQTQKLEEAKKWVDENIHKKKSKQIKKRKRPESIPRPGSDKSGHPRDLRFVLFLPHLSPTSFQRPR